ncbi:hypothetical protein RIF29_45440 [Crotalaria pallida]|uniref:Uncharacterized protein n=1 Tax=Crotalaria pallida TaxID=3830 RepID=A0AAN9DR99_CROPI
MIECAVEGGAIEEEYAAAERKVSSVPKSAGQIANPDFPRIKKRKRDEDPSLELDSKKARLDDQGTSSDPSARAEVNPGVSQADFGLISRMPRGDAPFKVLDKRIRLPLSIFESVSIDLDSVSPEETRQVLGENKQAYLLIQRVEDVMNLKWALGLGSHFLLSFLEKSFTVFCESLLMMWLFLEVRTLLPDQGNKEKIKRVMNSIELALLDRISQSLPFRLRPLLLNSNSAGSGVLERRLGSARELRPF